MTAPYIENQGVQSKELTTPPNLNLPLIFTTTVGKVEIVVPPPSTVLEGIPFPVQPVIRVLDQNGNPLAGKMVIALKIGKRGSINPYNYEFKKKGCRILLTTRIGEPVKDLLYPIPAKYDETFMNAVYSHNLEPIMTDQAGYVTFTNLAFSEKGYAGNSKLGRYVIVFICDGVYSSRAVIQVMSKVEVVDFLEDVPPILVINPYEELHFSPVLRIATSSGSPVEGKMPSRVEIVPVTDDEESVVQGYMYNEMESFKASGPDGLFVLPFRISTFTTTLETLKVKLRVFIDDITVDSGVIELMTDPDITDSTTCTGLKIVSHTNNTIDIVL